MEHKTNNKFTISHRLLHWGIGVAMLVLFCTGFLRMYWMSKKTMIEAISEEAGVDALSKDQMVAIAKQIRQPMWQWHEYAAYVALVCIGLRLVYMLVKGIKFPNPLQSTLSLTQRFQGGIYVCFYAFMVLSTVTGFYLKWFGPVYKDEMEMAHKWAIYWFPLFIVFHIVGVIIGELTKDRGVVSKMISGDKE